MMDLCYNILINGKRLRSLSEITIFRSVTNISSTALLRLPLSAKPLITTIKRGDKITADIGYSTPRREFEGYITQIRLTDVDIEIDCENEAYLLRNIYMDDEQLEKPTLNDILLRVSKKAGIARLECDFSFGYASFVIYKATCLDVLMKIQEETRAHIFLKDGVLHLHPQYLYIGNKDKARYDFSRNIHSSSLSYEAQDTARLRIEAESLQGDGTRLKASYGAPQADTVRSAVFYGINSVEELRALAKAEFEREAYSAYRGDFSGWLVPYTEPASIIRLTDPYFPEREGEYYVTETKTSLSARGGVRKITVGRKT